MWLMNIDIKKSHIMQDNLEILTNRMKTNNVFQMALFYSILTISSVFIIAGMIKIRGLEFSFNDGIRHAYSPSYPFFKALYNSGLYWKFLGLAQIIAGILICFQITRCVGNIIFSTVMVNILMINLSFDAFQRVIYVTIFMLLVNMILFIYDWERYKPLFMNTVQNSSNADLDFNIMDSRYKIILKMFFIVMPILLHLLTPQLGHALVVIYIPLGILGFTIHIFYFYISKLFYQSPLKQQKYTY